MAPRLIPFCPLLVCTLILGLPLLTGCGKPSKSSADSSKSRAVATKPLAKTPGNSPAKTPSSPPAGTPRNFHGVKPQGTRPQDKGPQNLSDLLYNPDGTEKELPPSDGSSPGGEMALSRLDDTTLAKLAAVGIRKLESKHLLLLTDLPSDPAIDELPAIFDLAVPQWCEYFHIAPARVARWKMIAYLIKDRDLFRAQQLLSDSLPEFKNGYQRGNECWLYEQLSPYYRRHLLLHEGTHGFMTQILGGGGPPWYMEGTAELLGTHRWQDGQLKLRYMPATKEEVPYWGRVKIIKDRFAEGNGLVLTEILQFGPRAHLEVDPYAWCWGASAFFDNHPRYQATFRALQKHVKLDGQKFSERFYQALEKEWPQISVEWQLFIVNCEYGYDVARSAIEFVPGQPLTTGEKRLSIQADRSWQSSGVLIEAGKTYRIDARGQYVVAAGPKPWLCEPGGVTIRYYKGQPLGIVQAALLDEAAITPQTVSPLARPIPIGLGRTITPETSGTLYLRINDSAAELADNSGQIAIRIQAATATD